MSGLQVKTCTNGEIILQEDTIRKFKESLRGELILSDNAGYDDARSIWNAMIDRRPALIVRCLGVTDVVTCVNFARERGLILSIKSGGHNISGLAVCEGGLMLDMSRMRGVWVNPSTRTARVKPAVSWATWTARLNSMALLRCSALSRTRASRVSRLVVGSVTSRAGLAGPATTSCRWRWSPRTDESYAQAIRKTAIFLGPLRRRRQLRSRDRLRV